MNPPRLPPARAPRRLCFGRSSGAWLVLGALILTSRSASLCAAEPAVSFSREILPILSDHCFSCHGPDDKKRQGGLRLDTRDGALALKQGHAAVVPGDAARSTALQRLLSQDPDEMMPPPTAVRRPSSAEIDRMRRWIGEGAPWGRHWSLERPRRSALPEGTPTEANLVDAWVVARLRAEGLELSPAAEPSTRLRRASFDLTGLPPTPEERQAFETDRRPEAWERAIDRLLASPHFGERMAMWWLDAARYADTDGYQADETRTNWPWRDWVVAAFNANLPFDRFTVEQFAGDLLPNATPEQKLATCFHRNHMTNGEGGRDPEESRIDYVIDRVNTVGTVWLGLTLGCCQCHSHKFDPVSQADYYRLNAFFNSIDEDGRAGRGAKPYLSYQSPQATRAVEEARQWVETQRPAVDQARRAAEVPFAHWLEERWEAVRSGFQPWHILEPKTLETTEGTVLTAEADGIVQANGPSLRQDDYRLVAPVNLPRITGIRLEVFPATNHSHGAYSFGASGEFILTDIKVQVRRRGGTQVRDIAVANAVADFSAPQKEDRSYGDIKGVLDDDPRNGWTTRGETNRVPHLAVFALSEPLRLAEGEELVFELRQRSTVGDANLGRFRVAVTDQPGRAVRSLEPMPLERLAAARLNALGSLDPKLRAALFEQFLVDHPPFVSAQAALDRATAQFEEARQAAGKLDVMVLAERKEPRPTHVLVRGVWDRKGEVVERGVPAAVATWPANAPTNRLGLAQWLVSPDQPLTARVIVNQLWQLCFGAGLVRTPEDFGVQGERPTHPELLDALAVEFMESGWDVKRLLRLIVTSRTYQQRSEASAELWARDPQNRWLARGARFRLPSWMLRDAALRYAGHLNPALGGPPVRPHQPEGLWEENFMGRFHYEPSEGAAQYRRTLYAFWRRTIAPVFLFDSAQRRVCEVRIPRTNTPLQALALLNDLNFLEAGGALADALAEAEPPAAIDRLFQRVLSRAPSTTELRVLSAQFHEAQQYYEAHPDEAQRLRDRARARRVTTEHAPIAAAHLVLASLVLNLDETLTHE